MRTIIANKITIFFRVGLVKSAGIAGWERKSLDSMRLCSSLLACVSVTCLLVCPALARQPESSLGSAGHRLGLSSIRLASGTSPSGMVAKRDKQPIFDEQQILAMADARLASSWIARAYDIPARVPEEMLFEGYSYGDTLVALAIMDEGASLNEVLEQRTGHRWAEVARSVGLSSKDLPPVIRRIMATSQNLREASPLHFIPDVHSGLSSRSMLPSFSPTIPDQVSIGKFRLSEEEVRSIRWALANSNNLKPSMLTRPAGRSLTTADWVIAATIAKYKPFPLETLLASRTGEVVEWGDIASVYSVDSQVFCSGPLAGVYAVLADTSQGVVLPTLLKEQYPEGISADYRLSQLGKSEESALRWLMSMYYQENSAERNTLEASELPMVEQGLVLAIARMADVEVAKVLEQVRDGLSWKAIVDSYQLDLSGEEVFWAAAAARDRQ